MTFFNDITTLHLFRLTHDRIGFFHFHFHIFFFCFFYILVLELCSIAYRSLSVYHHWRFEFLYLGGEVAGWA